MDEDEPDETITLRCHKTGREYDAPVTIDGDEATVYAGCPYCENRGAQAIIDDIQQRIEDVQLQEGGEE